MNTTECMNGEQGPRWYFAHVQDDLNLHILCMFEGTFSQDVAQIMFHVTNCCFVVLLVALCQNCTDKSNDPFKICLFHRQMFKHQNNWARILTFWLYKAEAPALDLFSTIAGDRSPSSHVIYQYVPLGLVVSRDYIPWLYPWAGCSRHYIKFNRL